MLTLVHEPVKQVDPSKPGYIEPRSGRVAVLLCDYADSVLNADRWAYWFNAEADSVGCDPWACVVAARPCAEGNDYEMWLAEGSSKTADPHAVIFMAPKDAAELHRRKALADAMTLADAQMDSFGMPTYSELWKIVRHAAFRLDGDSRDGEANNIRMEAMRMLSKADRFYYGIWIPKLVNEARSTTRNTAA